MNHSGDLDNGHYTAYCKNAVTQRWHRFDDEIVSDIPSYLIQSPNAYILFYTCQDFRLPCLRLSAS
ncbi:UNVERIFIED_CONTAM: hypothetical protein FKN15_001242 [Acipenser sinensis]